MSYSVLVDLPPRVPFPAGRAESALLETPVFDAMQISVNNYPVPRPPAAPLPPRDEARVEPAPAASPALPRRLASPVAGLPDDGQQARLRGRPVEAGASFASRQALARYADVERLDASRAQVEVLRIDVYV